MTDQEHTEEVIPEPLSSEEEFDDEDDDTEASSTDLDEKIAEEDVFDAEFFKCYSALKKKDDKIYDKNVRFFDDAESSGSDNDEKDKLHKSGSDGETLLTQNKKKSHSPKVMTLLDHQLQLSKQEAEEQELDGQPKIDLNKPVSKSYYEKELEEIKKDIGKISENVNSDSEDDFLIVKNPDSSKPRKQLDKILDQLEEAEDQEIKHLKQIWTEPAKLSEEDKFLRDYILNKRYVPANSDDEKDADGFFSKNLDELSDVESEKDEAIKKRESVGHRSDEKDFEKVSRIPRNSTKTIRDLVEKRVKKEKRLKKLEKEKKKKKAIKNADFEDMVGDLPTKFHYRETEPNDYGLTAQELLMATDEELEKWISLKDTIAYKSTEEELAQKRRFEKKRTDLEAKKQIFKSIYGDSGDEDNKPGSSGDTSKKKRKRKVNEADPQVEDEDAEAEVEIDTQMSSRSQKKKKRKRGLAHKKFAKSGVAPDRLLAYGVSKTKLKKSKLL